LQICHVADFDTSVGTNIVFAIWSFWDYLASQRKAVVFERSYFARQVQVCTSLARVTDDPALKRRYEALAVEFAQNIGRELDRDMNPAPQAIIDPKPGSGDTDP
jgi:hypothetical protein